MSDANEQPAKRKRGRPRLIMTAADAIRRQRVRDVVKKVQTADLIGKVLVRAWLAGELGLTPDELDDYAHTLALKAYLAKNPHLTAEFVKHRKKHEGKTP